MQVEILNCPIDYEKALLLMEDLIFKKEEKILILEHNDVFTYGKGHLYNGDRYIDGIKVLKSTRGGDLTYHGIGQVICYFIFDYKTRNVVVSDFINLLEDFVINFLLKYFAVIAKRSKLGRGVWIDDKKIMFIGLNASRGYISHGISINYNINLSYFKLIKPCNLDTMIGNIIEFAENKIDIRYFKEILKKEIELLWDNNFSSI